MSIPREKKVIVIGDTGFSLIGAAAGTDYYIFRNDCSELDNVLTSEDYGVYIILRDVYNKCSKYFKQLYERNVLVVVVDPPKVMKEIKPKEYYEELIAKYIGLKISL